VSNVEDAPTTGKGRATPKRTQARAIRATERKGGALDKKARSAARRSTMREMREAMNQTDVSKLPARERVPELVFTRDLVDSRFYAGQALIWAMLVAFLANLVPGLYLVTTLGGATALIVILGSTFLDCRRIQSRVRERYPSSTVPVRFYAAQRIFAPRRLRKPVPRVARGATVR
jgi:hypothetical protein